MSASREGHEPRDAVAVVVGAGGGIGSAFLDKLAGDPRYGRVLALSRTPVRARDARVVCGRLDLTDEPSIAEAAALARATGTVRLVIVATGLLHDEAMRPEKHWGALDGNALARSFAINAVGPALVAKHFLPLFPREGRSVFAAISARVGSIGDNRLGGWHAYRASKAALNMLLRTLAIELGRRSPEALCIGLHPGTVATRLSEPFRGQVPDAKLFTPEKSATHLLQVIDSLDASASGGVFAWDGKPVPP
jgi:NAD(P)-dependent dehydrogenase (short-subunit alcohol dehydrogenase family)